MNGKEMAAALGLSAAMVSKLRKRGMPMESVERAERWRRRNLEPARTKAMRMNTIAGPVAPAVPAQPLAPLAKEDPLAAEFLDVAYRDPEVTSEPFTATMEAELRSLLRRMPFSVFRWLWVDHQHAYNFVCRLVPQAFHEWCLASPVPDDEWVDVSEFDLPLLYYLAAGAATFEWDPAAPAYPEFRACIRLCAVDDDE